MHPTDRHSPKSPSIILTSSPVVSPAVRHMQIEALMADKQQLNARVSALQHENDQLVELVGHLHEALDTQVELQVRPPGSFHECFDEP